MLYKHLLPLLLGALLCGGAHAACSPVKFGYPDQNRPPYWMGQGQEVPSRPGVSVELVRRVAASAGCPVDFKRLPVLRILPAVASGEIDFASVDASAAGTSGIVFPLDKNKQPDIERAAPMTIVAFVRAEDHVARDADPVSYFKGKTVGATLGAPYAQRLRQAGMEVDTGATNVARNFEKLRRGRIDGFVVSLVSASDMDSYVAEQYGDAFVRLPQAVFTDHIWLAANQQYYDSHRSQVEAMWAWLGASGKKEFAALLEKYAGKQ